MGPASFRRRLAAEPPVAVGAPSQVSAKDDELFHTFGWGPQVSPRFGTIIAGFHYFARVQPDTIAAEHKGKIITYAALNAQANAWAFELQKRGVTRGDFVCLYLKRSIPMLIGILATMKLGAAYVPQDVGVAADATLEHIATVTNAKVILTLEEMVDALPNKLPEVLPITELPMVGVQPEDARPEDLAIVLFTSGTTGIPNGVQVTHKNLCNVLHTAPGDLGMRPGLRVGQILSISFDMAAWETLGALSNGATLVIRGKSIEATAKTVDVLISTPSTLIPLDPNRCSQVKVVAVAGEPCPRALADTWASFCAFYNCCGPTETTIINTAAQHFPHKKVLSIGCPTPNNTVYVLNGNLNPMHVGEKGEMWAGGDGVTAGYLSNPTLTSERYRPDPFRPGHMMFRTCDLGCWTEDGELEHFGRVDDQVKIRGFRVELDGVSAVLETTEGCKQAVTLKFNDQNLVSFISPITACPYRAMQSAESRLPYYSRPTLVLVMEELPRTSRGKIDKRLLLELARAEIKNRDVTLY